MVTRRIFALGGGFGGEHQDTYKPTGGDEHFPWDTEPIDRLIVTSAQKGRPKILHLSTPSEDGLRDVDLLHQAFSKRFGILGCETDILKVIQAKPDQKRIKNAIAWADIVYVSGGNIWRAVKRWRHLGLDILLKKAYEQGTVMSGLSAGAICWFQYGNSRSMSQDTIFIVRTLGWIEALACPHYDIEPFRQEPFKEMLKRTPKLIGIALDEHATIEIVDEKSFKVHIRPPGGKARKCYWQRKKYVIEELDASKQYKPLAQLLTID